MAVFVLALSAALAAGSKPHVIFTMVDDLGYNGFGFNGHNSEIITPTIDKLAQDGVILTNHYTVREPTLLSTPHVRHHHPPQPAQRRDQIFTLVRSASCFLASHFLLPPPCR